MDKEDKLSLKKFLYDNRQLELLESIIDDFNIFSALSIINNEIRHSSFLAWLMNPVESHGFGDYFLKSFLKNLIFNSEDTNKFHPTIFEIDEYDLANAEVLTEWKNIDITIRDDTNKLICIVENKINSKEHGEQLNDYQETIEKEFTYGYKKKIFIYLTKDGEIPSNNAYIPIDYSQIIQLIDKLIHQKKDKTNIDIIQFIIHYKKMLKRYVMADSEIQQICKSIYKNHKRALKLIFDHKPDIYLNVYEDLIRIIKEDKDLILDNSSKGHIRFLPKSLDYIPKLGNGWTKTRRVLLFEIKNKKEGLFLYLIIGPGEDNIREKYYNLAKDNRDLYNKVTSTFNSKWNTIYMESIAKIDKYEELEEEELFNYLKSKFNEIKVKTIAQLEKDILIKGK